MNYTLNSKRWYTAISTLLILSVLVLVSACDQEVEGLAEVNLPAPSAIDAVFTISNDNTGTLDIAPSGAGVVRFELLFGDVAEEEPTVLLPGETATHQYAEGDFMLEIKGIGADGQSTSMMQEIVIRFDPPENLVVDLQVSNRSLTVTPTADGATLFEVLFGDEAEGAAATQVMPGQNVTHIYESIGDYTVQVIARGAGAAFAEYSEVITIAESITLPIDFEANDVSFNFVNFGGAVSEVVDNPDLAGNPSAKVARFTKTAGAETFAGSTLEVSEPLDFNRFGKIKVNVWSPKTGAIVKIKVENAADGNIAYEVDQTTTIAGGWEELVYDFREIDASQEYTKVIIFFDFGNAGDGAEYYFDAINLTNSGGPVLGLPLDFESTVLTYSFESFGGAAALKIANPDPSGLNSSSHVANIFKSNGSEVWAGAFLTLDGPIDFSTNKIFSVKTWSPKVGAVVKLKVENSADGNIALEVDQTTTVANAWEMLSFDFSAIDVSQTYDRVVLFFDFGNPGDGSDYYYDEVVLGNGTDQLGLPLNFESATLSYTFENFGGAESTVITNPDPSGINASNTVARLVKSDGSEVWAGSFIQLPQEIDFSSRKIFKVKVWSPKAGAVVKLKVENEADGNIALEIDQTTTVANAWEEITYDFSAIDETQSYHKVVIFFDFGNPGDGSAYYYDDITLTN